MANHILIILSILISTSIVAQSFYLGADMSYVNEMEDCGVIYHENQSQKAPYTILENHGGNLVRLRLWHTPTWYDDLNNGKRYSDLNDVLNNGNLLPEMIQIGNETNKGILLSPDDNSTWTLDWALNADLFNHALKAVTIARKT